MGGGVGAGEFVDIYIPLTIFSSKMRFKAKLRRIGNSQGIYIPLKVITGYSLGEEIELEVITQGEETKGEASKVITQEKKVITPKKVIASNSSRYELCPKHPGSMKVTCGCK